MYSGTIDISVVDIVELVPDAAAAAATAAAASILTSKETIGNFFNVLVVVFGGVGW